LYPKLRCGDETKADIETGIPEHGDQRLAGGIGRADDSVHERLAGTLPLTARQDADRSEPECVEYADAPAIADDEADDLIVTLRNHRQRRAPSGILAKRAEQTRLHRLSINPGPAKGSRSHGVDRCSILKHLATDEHERLLANGPLLRRRHGSGRGAAAIAVRGAEGEVAQRRQPAVQTPEPS
jgi:hypothetical protein